MFGLIKKFSYLCIVKLEYINDMATDVELCPVCKKGMLVDGFVCPHCGYGE